MTGQPLVSVVLPMFNAERWVEAAIASVLSQSWPLVEVIVVDDGSTDGSLSIARRLEGPRVRILTQRNAGASAARNRGASAARGDYVQYLDADDLLDPGKIGAQLDRLRSAPPDSVASASWARFRDDPAAARFEPEPVWADRSPVDWLVASWGGGGMMPNSAWLVPRSVVERAGPWDERLTVNDDGEYFARVLLASGGVVFCEAARCFYRSGIEGSLSARASSAARDSHFRSIVLAGERLLEAEDTEATRRAYAAQLQRFVYEVYPDRPDLVSTAEQRLSELGGARLRPPSGGKAFEALSRVAGWKAARRLQRLVRRPR